MSPADSSFAGRLAMVERRIAKAAEQSGRPRQSVQLIAVSKKFGAAALREAYGCGMRDFGENYVQEFAGKRPELNDLTGARYHLIGHLQSNKARIAAELFDVVQTVDSARLLLRLQTAAAEQKRRLSALIEVKLGEEESKSGCGEDDIGDILKARADCPDVEVRGLMTIPPWSDNAEASRSYFRRLAQLAAVHGLRELSMGMSSDLEVAIEEGATIVRVGTALFGQRPKPL